MTNKVYFATANLGDAIGVELPRELKSHATTNQSLLAWALLLEKYRNVYNENLPMVSFLSSGKPVIDGGYISISHSADLVAVCFSKTAVVGVDIELIKDAVPQNVSKFLNEKNPPEFYKKWTEREAVIKAKNYSALKKGVEEEFVGITEIVTLNEKAFSLSVYGENAQFIKV